MELKILQWNAQGLRNKTAQLIEALITDDIHIALIQESLCRETTSIRTPGYQQHMLPWEGTGRGLLTLVKADLPSVRIQNPVECGEGTERLGVQVHLGENTILVYNIYHSITHDQLNLTELFSEAEYQPLIIAGDFNAHHPFLQTPGRTNLSGHHIHHIMEDAQTMQLLNDVSEPTHIHGGRLDLIFASISLTTGHTWRVHSHLASDHYAVVTTFTTSYSNYAPSHPTGWNIKKADWTLFEREITQWWEQAKNQPEGTLDDQERKLMQALNAAAERAIPHKKNGRYHRDWWFYCDKVKEMNARVNLHRKILRRHRTQDNLRRLRDVITHSREVANQARTSQWFEWCATFNQHTSLAKLWGKLKTATGQRRKKTPAHPHPRREADRLMMEFANRASDQQLPADIRAEQQRRRGQREEAIEGACNLASETDTPFTTQELQHSGKRSTDTAPGRDGITYSMILHSGNAGTQAILSVINHSWRVGKLPSAWKHADITPIPKPKEENKYRPISLTSCICKTMERMVRARLEWKLGQLHHNIYGFSSGKGTTECIMELLSHVRDKKTYVVFLDIEKAFELANPLAILDILIKKGVTGQMLMWIRDYLTERKARVTFQGHTSTDHLLQNGTPQGGVISPLLFNLLMEDIVSMKLPQFCYILSYADDLVLIVKGAKPLDRVQLCLDHITNRCKTLGLKLSHTKSKAMVVKGRNPDTRLTIQGSELEWVKSYLYLGVWIDQSLTFGQELDYVREKTNLRLNAMRAMTNPRTGANESVLRLYYLQAIRTHVDYAAPALVALSESNWTRLEPIQNRAMRIIAGAPPWTSSPPMLREFGLVPLRTRVQERVACLAAKVVQQGKDSKTRTLIWRNMAIGVQQRVGRRKRWGWEITQNIKHSMDGEDIRSREHDQPDHNYRPSPPWEERGWKIVTNLPRLTKKTTTLPELQQLGRETVATLATEGTAVYFTDGSVSQEDGRAGAAFITQGAAYGWRTSDHASSTQTELAAIIQATRHVADREETSVVIFTDSLTALQALQHDQPKDNVRLITTAITLLNELQQQGKQVTLAWIPSHAGIQGNERADEAAKRAASMQRLDVFTFPPSLQMTKSKIKTTTHKKAEQTTTAACSMWYKTATDLQTLTLDSSASREDKVNLLRLRLGYRTAGEITLGSPTTICEKCGSEEEDQLVHYLLGCPQTARLRTRIRPPSGYGREVAAQYVKRLLKFPNITTKIIRDTPPPK